MATRIDPSLAIAYHNRAREYEIHGNNAEAVRDYRAALELQPNLIPSREGLKRLSGED